MKTPPTLQTAFSGYGKPFAASLASGVVGCAAIVAILALIVFVREIVTETNTEVPEHLTIVVEETQKKKTKAPTVSGPERVITVPTGPALVRIEPAKITQERPELVEIPEVEQPDPDLLVLDDLEENPFEEKKEVVEPQKETRTAKAETPPAKRQGPSKAEIEAREKRRLASLAKQISKEARVVSRVTPRYPRSAIRKRLEGRVVVTVTVAPSGKVSGCRISKSSGHAILDQSALSAAKKHRFQPAKNGLGQSVSVKKLMPFHFQLAG